MSLALYPSRVRSNEVLGLAYEGGGRFIGYSFAAPYDGPMRTCPAGKFDKNRVLHVMQRIVISARQEHQYLRRWLQPSTRPHLRVGVLQQQLSNSFVLHQFCLAREWLKSLDRSRRNWSAYRDNNLRCIDSQNRSEFVHLAISKIAHADAFGTYLQDATMTDERSEPGEHERGLTVELSGAHADV